MTINIIPSSLHYHPSWTCSLLDRKCPTYTLRITLTIIYFTYKFLQSQQTRPPHGRENNPKYPKPLTHYVTWKAERGETRNGL